MLSITNETIVYVIDGFSFMLTLLLCRLMPLIFLFAVFVLILDLQGDFTLELRFA